MILLAEQTQFAVGQGGLHLTQLHLGDEVLPLPYGSQPFSLVYDCGGYGSRAALRRGVESVRQALPRNAPAGHQHLDVLVLSHLHADHINGFKRLVAGPPLTIGTLIIPHYDDDHQLILLAQVAASTGDMNAVQEVNDVVRDPGAWFGERGVVSVVAVRPGNEDTPPFEPGPDGLPTGFASMARPEPTAERGTPGLETVVRVRGPVEPVGRMTVVSPGTHLAVQQAADRRTPVTDWAFVPYCQRWTSGSVRAKPHQAFVQAVRACLAPYRQQNGSLLIGPADANSVRDCLTAAFLSYLGRKVADATWNVLSVCLFGGPLRQRNWCNPLLSPLFHGLFLDARVGPGGWYEIVRWLDWPPHISLRSWSHRRGNWMAPQSPSAACGWMLTGDSDLTGGAAAWSRFYRALLPLVGIFQLPHHGSVHNSDDALPLGNTTLPFVTCRNGDTKHPAPDVKAFLAKKGLHLARVTTDSDSAVRSIALLKV
ncbi:MAG: hypothetical protein INF74_09000 [Roseomonas sp.]|nr:hypothetical protein [Roseomonas sp.]